MRKLITVVLAALMGAFILVGCESKDTNLSVTYNRILLSFGQHNLLAGKQ